MVRIEDTWMMTSMMTPKSQSPLSQRLPPVPVVTPHDRDLALRGCPRGVDCGHRAVQEVCRPCTGLFKPIQYHVQQHRSLWNTRVMNSLVVLVACLAAASASYAGYGWAGAHYGYAPYAYAGHGWYGGHGGYHGPLAAPVVLPSGYLADTPEVAAAKGAHLNAVANAAHRTGAYAGAYGHGYGHGYGYGKGYYGGYYGGYHGPQAVPVVLPSGYLADTPDVAAVKASHLTAVAHQGGATHTGYGHGYPYGYGYGYGHGHGYYHH
ncbi:shematrin-like protein 1 [Homalodisca vitripennis]|uniref:shematrin-like protein 1 n=1 Tax=Homalodisca vitripennis TaxID=197043 RepID=UPI001EEBA384|nr:shematrin-like protein 1 [Homalodisca vitripennis]KAG8328285.1 hypothetical protein J6590_000945 [Homalodisca vitripennis]